MDLVEYEERLQAIEARAEKDKYALNKEYAMEHAIAREGDVVTDHIGSVLVQYIRIFASYPPYCVYAGRVLTKKLVPTKRPRLRGVHQINIIDQG